jgi:Putative zinc-finger
MKNCIDANCIDEGTIQAFLDGELAGEANEFVATHIGDCDACAMLLADAEEENSFAFAALDNEFNIPVPTHRLWTKINDEIEKSKPTFWQKLSASFIFKSPSLIAFASLLVVFGMLAIVWNSRQTPQLVATNIEPKQSETPKQVEPTKTIPAETPEIAEVTPPKIIKVRNVSPKNIPNFKIEKANFVNETPRLKVEKTRIIEKTSQPIIKNQTPETEDQTQQLINGEDTYIKTIETLSKNVDAKKDQILRPSARVSYERDIALVEQAIKTMQTKSRKNPKDEGAKQVLFASYQNKIDLLNSVAEKGELLASLK